MKSYDATKGMRLASARNCLVHQKIIEVARDTLLRRGYFEKEKILDKAKLKTMAHSIAWHHVVTLLNEGPHEFELIPLGAGFFKAEDSADRLANPRKYLAGGHGGKTAGYCTMDYQDCAFAKPKLEQKKRVKDGAVAAHKSFAGTLRRHEKRLPSKDNDRPSLQ